METHCASTQARSTARAGSASTSPVSTQSASTNVQASSRPPRTAPTLVTPLSAGSSSRGFSGSAGTAGTTARMKGPSSAAASPSLGSASTSVAPARDAPASSGANTSLPAAGSVPGMISGAPIAVTSTRGVSTTSNADHVPVPHATERKPTGSGLKSLTSVPVSCDDHDSSNSTAESSNRPARTITPLTEWDERIAESSDQMTESIYPAAESNDTDQISHASSATSTTSTTTATVLRLRGGSDAGPSSSDDGNSAGGPIQTFGDAGMIDIAACPLGFDLDTDEPMPESRSAGLASDPMSRSGLTTPGDEDDDEEARSARPHRTGGPPQRSSMPKYLSPFLRKRHIPPTQSGRRNAYGFWFNESRERSAIAREAPMEVDADSIVDRALSFARLDELSSWFMREAITRAPHIGCSPVRMEKLDIIMRFRMPPNLAFLFQRLADSAAALTGGAVAVCVADNAKSYLRVAATDALRPYLTSFLLRVVELIRAQVECGSAREFAYEWDSIDFKDLGATNDKLDKLGDALAISYAEDDLIGLRRSLTNPLFIKRLNGAEFAALERSSRDSHAEVGMTLAEEKLARREQECRDLREELDRLQATLDERDDEISRLRTKPLKRKPVFPDVARSLSANGDTSSAVAPAQQQGSEVTTAQHGGKVATADPARSEARPPLGVDARSTFTADSTLEEQWMTVWHGRLLAESLRLQVSPPQSTVTSPMAGKDESATKAGFFGITSVGVGITEEERPRPDVLYRSNLDDTYYASNETIGGRSAGFMLCRQFPTAPGFTFAGLLANLFPRVGSIFVSIFTIGPHLFSILTSPPALEWASQCGVSLAFHARQSDAPRLMTSLEHANKYIASHLASNSNLDAAERARPRFTMVQIMMAGNGAHHAKELIAATRDGTSMVVWEGSANPSRQGFGGDGLDDAGLAPSFTSYETGTLSFIPACSATAGSILAEHDNFMAFLTERGLLLRATRASCVDIGAALKLGERSAGLSCLPTCENSAGASRKPNARQNWTDRRSHLERIPPNANLPTFDRTVGLNLGQEASLNGLGAGPTPSVLAAESRGLILAEDPTGEALVRIGLTGGSWDTAEPGLKRKVYACCYGCHKLATGTSPAGLRGWRVTHPNPVGTCPQHLRSTTGCLYEGDAVDQTGDGTPRSVQDRDQELVNRIKILQTCRFVDSDTALVIYDPVTVWYLLLRDHLHGYQAIAESLVAFRDQMHVDHPARDVFTSMIAGVGAEKGPDHLSSTLKSRLLPVITFHNETAMSPSTEAGKARDVLDYLYPLAISSDAEERS